VTPSNTATNTHAEHHELYVYTVGHSDVYVHAEHHTQQYVYTVEYAVEYLHAQQHADKTDHLRSVCACSEVTGEPSFTVVNNGGGPLNETPTYTVTGPNGYSQTGTFGPLASTDSVTIDLGSVAPGTYTFNAPYSNGQLTLTTDVTCVEPPDITVTGECSEATLELVFTITNNGGPLDDDAPYTVTGPNGYSDGRFTRSLRERRDHNLGSVAPGTPL
jgi:hypothetical protein